MNLTILQNAFTGGEISPYLGGRIDSAPYKTGCRIMENFLPMRQGPLRRRPGTYHVGTTRKPSTTTLKARLVEFVDTSGVNWVLEFTDLKVRIYSVGYHNIVGAPTELTTTILEAELFEMRYAINAGALWIAHHNHKVQKINYTVSGGIWAITEPTFTGITFSTAGNYPAVVAFNAGRLVLAATDTYPTAIYCSKAPDSATGASRFTDFTVGSTVDAAIALMESDMGGTSLRWAAPNKRFTVATDRRTWTETSSSTSTPSGFDLDIVGVQGSANIQGQQADTILAYVSANGQALRALIYNYDLVGFQDIEISGTFEHILKPGIVDLRVQSDPDPIIWLVRSDGVLVSVVLDVTASIISASRHLMGGSGKVESIAVVRGSAGDEIWMSVLRGTTRTVEYMVFRQDSDTTCLHFVDDGLHLTPGSATVAGLAHLEGALVAAVGDGAVLPERTVASAQVVYDSSVTDIHIGYPFTSTALLGRPEIQINGSTSQGKNKKIEEITLRLLNSAGGAVGQTLAVLKSLLYLVPGTYVWGSAPALFSGDIKTDFPGVIDTDADIYIVQAAPMPFTVLAVMAKISPQAA